MNIKKFKRYNNQDVLINVEKITSVITSEKESETLIYFNDDDCVRIKATLEEVANILSEIGRASCRERV